MAKHTLTWEERLEIAVWRFSYVAPIVNESHNFDSIMGYCRAVTENPLVNPVTSEQIMYSPNTIRSWALDYRKGGLEALVPGERADIGRSRSMSPGAQKKTIQLMTDFPKMPNTRIREKLIEESYISPSVSQSSIDRFVKNNKDTAEARRLNEIHVGKERKSFSYPHINSLWQCDTTFLKAIGGRKVALMIIIDDCSRFVVGYGLFFEDNAVNFLSVLKKAIAVYGRPTMLYCDNGAPYANKQLELILADLQIQLIHTPVRDGAAKGKIERYNRTLKTRWLSSIDWNDFKSLDDVDASFKNYLFKDYHISEHSALENETEGFRTPNSRFFQEKSRIRRIPLSELDEKFLYRCCRKVKTDSTLRYNSTWYEVPSEYMGESVHIFVDPWDASKAWFSTSLNDPKMPLLLLNKNENAHTTRKQHISYRKRSTSSKMDDGGSQPSVHREREENSDDGNNGGY